MDLRWIGKARSIWMMHSESNERIRLICAQPMQQVFGALALLFEVEPKWRVSGPIEGM